MTSFLRVRPVLLGIPLLVLACSTSTEDVTSDALAASSNGTFLYGSSDSCSGSVVAVVGPSSNCSALGSGSVWSVKVGGRCLDISDTDVQTACRRYGGQSLLFGSSDSCGGSPVAAVGPGSDCGALGSASVWSVEIDGQCFDISDSDTASACRRFSGTTLLFGSSDSCGGSPVAAVGAGTDCSALGSGSVWSVKVGGQCIDISDTDARTACQQYGGSGGTSSGGGGGGGTLLYGSSDSCGGSPIAAVGPGTNCASLSSSSSVWSVRVDGDCLDISDTNAQDACRLFSGDTLLYGSSDSCGGSPVAAVGAGTDCNALSTSASVWSVKIDGQCLDIGDTNAQAACKRWGGKTILYGSSDTCGGSAIGAVGSGSDCAAFGNESVWSVRANGECLDISDTTARAACETYGG